MHVCKLAKHVRRLTLTTVRFLRSNTLMKEENSSRRSIMWARGKKKRWEAEHEWALSDKSIELTSHLIKARAIVWHKEESTVLAERDRDRDKSNASFDISIRWSQDNKAQSTVNDFFFSLPRRLSAYLEKRDHHFQSIHYTIHTHSRGLSDDFQALIQRDHTGLPYRGAFWRP